MNLLALINLSEYVEQQAVAHIKPLVPTQGECLPPGYLIQSANQDFYNPLAQIRDWTTAEGQSRQQSYYFHCYQVGIPKEMTDIHGNLLWFDNYTSWGRLKADGYMSKQLTRIGGKVFGKYGSRSKY